MLQDTIPTRPTASEPDMVVVADRVAALITAVNHFTDAYPYPQGNADRLLAIIDAAFKVVAIDNMVNVDLEELAGQLWMVGA